MTKADLRPIAIKLDADIRERVKRLADARRRSPHWMVREATPVHAARPVIGAAVALFTAQLAPMLGPAPPFCTPRVNW